jgi:hypothetical protein
VVSCFQREGKVIGFLFGAIGRQQRRSALQLATGTECHNIEHYYCPVVSEGKSHQHQPHSSGELLCNIEWVDHHFWQSAGFLRMDRPDSFHFI